MTAEALRADLQAVTGVASADVQAGPEGAPAGVKVQLAPGADARRVGVDVQRVLAAHGMRSRFTSPDDPEDAAESSSPSAPFPPAPLPADAVPAPPQEPPPAAPGSDEEQPAPPAPPPISFVPSPPDQDPPVAPPRIHSVALEERVDGLTAVVSLANGRSASRSLGFESGDLDEAVVAAFAEAAGRTLDVLGVEWMEFDSGSVVTVAIRDEHGSLAAGAGVQRAGRAFAVAAATRAALGA